MISDESSSDSETGRFKCQSKPEESKSSYRNNDSLRSGGRSRPDNDRFRRDFDRKREPRDHHVRRSRERNKYSRHSPVRRRHSRERSPNHRSRDGDRQRPSDQRPYSKIKEDRDRVRDRSISREKRRHSRSRSHKSPEHKKVVKEEVQVKPQIEHKPRSPTPERSSKFNRRARETSAESSPEYRPKRSEVRKPSPSETKKIDTPIVVEGNSSDSEEVVAGSYYNMAPTVVEKKKEEREIKSEEKEIKTKERETKSKEKEIKSKKSEESSEIDSSDDERLRAKLLNLERELHRTRKKKHKKKHKKSSSVSKSHDHDRESSAVEVTSTTDIDKVKSDVAEPIVETAEVSSTQKSQQKETSEEGEILSDDNSQDFEIEPTDLRHKLKRSQPKGSSRQDICGPALPPHLERRERSTSRDREGPALPPHLGKRSRNIGPTISEEVRQRLAEVDPKDMTFESSDEDDGIGPLPAGAEDKMTLAHQRLEARALDMKIKKLEGRSMHGSDKKSREQWMLELPEGKAKILGLQARSFRAKAAPDMSDRSSWTDTPEEKTRKAKGLVKEEDPEIVLQREAKARHIASRDADQEKAVKKHKKKHKRDESLLDLHQKKLKKKKKKEDKDEDKKERRPFSRDVDLQVNRFDEAQKKSVIRKAQELDTRFSRGEAKYL